MPSDGKSTGESPLVFKIPPFRRSLTRGDREGRIDDCRVMIADF